MLSVSTLVVGLLLALGPTARSQVLEGTLAASDVSGAQSFGQAVAMDGDVALVGASGTSSNAGAVYVYRRTAGVWSEEIILVPGDLNAADLLGYGVALDGDLAAAGAPDTLDFLGGSPVGPGAVYVFRDTGATWPQQDKLLASDGQTWDRFGWAVAASGDLIVVGAPSDEASGPGTRNGGRGAVYVFRFNGSTWSQEAKLVASDADAADQFGYSVGVDGDLIVVGTPDDEDAATLAGSAYVFRFNGSSWVEEDKFLASDAATEDVFGTSVAVSGDAILVGAPQDDDDGAYSGSVYVFRHNGSVWVQETKLASADATADAFFGRSVALRGARALVGAPGQIGGVGKAYTFTFGGSSWTEEAQLSDAGGVFLGHSGDLNDSGAVVGAPLSTSPPFALTGLAYVFGLFADCNNNGTPDDEDISMGTSQDCNSNGVPDECDIASGFSQDCNTNGIPDECETDCNLNGIPDD
ncbi:MAG: FG-GAP repeat protein [Planctomycetota bacterium]